MFATSGEVLENRPQVVTNLAHLFDKQTNRGNF